MVRTANKQMLAASRMVEVIRANGIYSSPIVKTKWIKAYNEKRRVLPSQFLSTQVLVRKGLLEGS
jgi:hypothetical protein